MMVEARIKETLETLFDPDDSIDTAVFVGKTSPCLDVEWEASVKYIF